MDRKERLKTPITAFSEPPMGKAQGLSMTASSEWIINFFATRARESEIIGKTDRRAGANREKLSHVEKAVALTKLYLELSLPLPDALRAAEADL